MTRATKLFLSIAVVGAAASIGAGATFVWDAPDRGQMGLGVAIAVVGTLASYGVYRWGRWMFDAR